MKFYTAHNAEISQGVEATVVFHNDNGDELILIRSGWQQFIHDNPSAEECSQEEADDILASADITAAVPSKKELRKTEPLTEVQILADIQSDESPTVAITKEETGDGQLLTFFEEKPITSTADFLQAQQLQAAALPSTIVDGQPNPINN